MSKVLPLPADEGGGRYPGFDVLGQSPHWDARTRQVIEARVSTPEGRGFFNAHELATVRALVDRLLAQEDQPRIAVELMIGRRLHDGETDGWRYADMPEDGAAWRHSLVALDEDAQLLADADFADASITQQRAVIGAVQDLGEGPWHGLPADHVWSLWTRYTSTAFYSHPSAWNEIGFGGPAYPRGYKNLGVGRRDPFEVADTRAGEDPVRRQ